MTRGTLPRLKTLEEIEREGLPGIVEGLREGGVEAVGYVLWDAYQLAPRLFSTGMA